MAAGEEQLAWEAGGLACAGDGGGLACEAEDGHAPDAGVPRGYGVFFVVVARRRVGFGVGLKAHDGGEVAKVAVAVHVAGEQDEGRAVVEVDFHADDRFDSGFAGMRVEGDHAEEVIAVGEGEGGHLEAARQPGQGSGEWRCPPRGSMLSGSAGG